MDTRNPKSMQTVALPEDTAPERVDATAFWRTYEDDRDARRLRQALLTSVGQQWLRELVALPASEATKLLAELVVTADD